MISFHFVSLTCWTQHCCLPVILAAGCDFLSFCIFDMLNTTAGIMPLLVQALWFPFILYLWHVEHNIYSLEQLKNTVVISFHFVSLTCWTQRPSRLYFRVFSCDFLSFCIFDMLNTTNIGNYASAFGCDFLSFCIFDMLNTTIKGR